MFLHATHTNGGCTIASAVALATRCSGETSIGASVPAGSIAAARHNKSIFVAEQFEAAPAAAATAEAGARCDRGSWSTKPCGAAGRQSLIKYLSGFLARAVVAV